MSRNEKLARDLNEVTYKDAVLASTTTPLTFPSLTYEYGEDKHRFIDGGEGGEHFNNNNPTKSLVVEALCQGYALENINVISLGTGKLHPESAQDKTKLDQ